MKHLGTKTIETERLILRRFTPGDAPAMYANWASDGEVTKFLTWPPHASVEVTRESLESWEAGYESDEKYRWAIVLKENGDEPIGSISGVVHDDRAGRVHVGYCIGRGFWNRGITTEALGAVIDFFLDEVGYNRVDARHDPRNPASGEVMKKCGMKYEGTLRRYDWNNQGVCDASWYAILASDRERGSAK